MSEQEGMSRMKGVNGEIKEEEMREGGREREREEERERKRERKDGPGPVMVSDTLCPAVHILGT